MGIQEEVFLLGPGNIVATVGRFLVAMSSVLGQLRAEYVQECFQSSVSRRIRGSQHFQMEKGARFCEESQFAEYGEALRLSIGCRA